MNNINRVSKASKSETVGQQVTKDAARDMATSTQTACLEGDAAGDFDDQVGGKADEAARNTRQQEWKRIC